MKVVIDINEETYKMCKRLLGDADEIERAIAKGIIVATDKGSIRKCNKCGYFLYSYKEDGKLKFDNFCPNCGADMRKEANNE